MTADHIKTIQATIHALTSCVADLAKDSKTPSRNEHSFTPDAKQCELQARLETSISSEHKLATKVTELQQQKRVVERQFEDEKKTHQTVRVLNQLAN